jgi:hypothetical protein
MPGHSLNRLQACGAFALAPTRLRRYFGEWPDRFGSKVLLF